MEEKRIVFGFARMQPPHVGHDLIMTAIEHAAKEWNAENRFYLSPISDNKRNPLRYPEKLKFARRIWPKINFADDPDVRHPYDALMELSNEGYTDVKIVCGPDRSAELRKWVAKYMGPDVDPVKRYDFKTFDVVEVGHRDRYSASLVESVSGTLMRKWATENEWSLFDQASAVVIKTKDLREIFQAVRVGLGLPRASFRKVAA